MYGPKKISAIVGMVLSSLGYSTISKAVEFGPAKTYSVGTNPMAVVVADFNGDGKQDIAVANSGSGNVSILLGNGDGTFQAAVNFDAGMAKPSSLAAGDFNNDGKPDLAVFQPGSAVSILLGNGNGTFQAPKTLALTALSSQLAVADFNGDKISDLAISEFDSNTKTMTVDIFIGKGNGTFQAAKQTSVANPQNGSFVAADFSGDSKADLAVATSAGILILLGNGDGAFQTLVVLPAPPNTTYDRFVAVGDFNGDQKLDLVLPGRKLLTPGCKEFCISLPVLVFYRGIGDGTFGSGVSRVYPAGNGVAGDFNADKKLDLFFPAVYGTGNLLLGREDGTFEPVPVNSPGPAAFVAAGDFNGDGLPDLAITDGINNTVVVLLNMSPTSGADLGIITLPSADPVGVGTNLTYTMNVVNEGPKDATGVKFTDTLPASVNFVSASSSQGSCIQSHGVVTCDIGSLASAFKSVVTMVVTPTAAGTITNSMNVAAAEPDLVLANNSVTQNTTILPTYMLSVSIAGGGSGSVTSSPGGISCATSGGTCSMGSILPGSSFVLAAASSGNSMFAGWSGACAATDPNACTVTLNSDQSVTATFNLLPDFVPTPAATTLTVKRGGQVSEQLTFPAQGGFSGMIALACSVTGTAPMPTCSVSPTSVTPGNSATLTVNAGALTAGLTPPPSLGQSGGLFAVWLPLGLVGCILRVGFDKKRRRMWLLCLLVMVATILPAACGSSSNTVKGPPPPQNFTVTMTATSGTIQHTTQISVTVQ